MSASCLTVYQFGKRVENGRAKMSSNNFSFPHRHVTVCPKPYLKTVQVDRYGLSDSISI